MVVEGLGFRILGRYLTESRGAFGYVPLMYLHVLDSRHFSLKLKHGHAWEINEKNIIQFN
jgi:hypothetical protein